MNREIYIPIKPKVKGRPRVTSRGTYTPKATREYEQFLKDTWFEHFGDVDPFDGPVGMEVVVDAEGIEINVYELMDDYRPRSVRGDIDNYVKAVQDALNGAAFLDDKQVQELSVAFLKE